MKAHLIKLSPLFIAALALHSCSTGQQKKDTMQKPQQKFASQQEAINKAKSDFVEIIRLTKDINTGVDADILEKAQATKPVRKTSISFDKLLAADYTTDFSTLTTTDSTTIVPFSNNGKIVAVAELNKDEKGWGVIGLNDNDISNTLNIIAKSLPAMDESTIILYEIPNLSTRVYGFTSNKGTYYFTDYDGFDLRRPISSRQLISILTPAANEFQKKYGDIIKKEKLVY